MTQLEAFPDVLGDVGLLGHGFAPFFDVALRSGNLETGEVGDVALWVEDAHEQEAEGAADHLGAEVFWRGPGGDDNHGEQSAAEELTQRAASRWCVAHALVSSRATESRAPGTRAKCAQVPRWLRLRNPASVSTLRWWETVGWLSPTGAVRSQAQAS